MQFVVLSDVNATDYVTRVTVPIFKDPTLAAWKEMQAGAAKHDTFVYARDGSRTLYWDASMQTLSEWKTVMRAAVEAQGK